MSDEPFRMPRPPHKEANDLPTESVEKVHEEPKVVRGESKKVNRGRLAENNSKKPMLIVAVVVLVLVAIVGWLGMSYVGKLNAAGIDDSKYQAVFFTNGQVYFGKLSNLNDKYFKLVNIYYLQTAPTSDEDAKKLQKASDESNNVTMVKLGDEIHGPQDEMIISRDQVLFYENLKDSSKVVTAISQYKNKK